MQERVLELREGEYIERVSGRAGTYVNFLRLQTTHGRCIQAGEPEPDRRGPNDPWGERFDFIPGDEFEFPPGRVAAFTGVYDSSPSLHLQGPFPVSSYQSPGDTAHLHKLGVRYYTDDEFPNGERPSHAYFDDFV